MSTRGRSSRSVAVLALSGALALVVLVLFSIWTLWSSAQIESDRTRLQALENARVAAAELRASFLRPVILDVIPAECSFRWRENALVVPDEIRWLRAPERCTREDLDVVVQQRLLAGDSAEAILSEIPSGPLLPPLHRDFVRVHGAWAAHRRGDRAARDRLLAPLEASGGGCVPVSAMLLHAEISGRLPPWAEARLPALPAAEAELAFGRLAELALKAPALARALPALREQHREILARRALLLEVARMLRGRSLPPDEAVFEAHEARALVLQERGDELRGALLDVDALRRSVARLTKKPEVGLPAGLGERIVGAERASSASFPVLDGFARLEAARAAAAQNSAWPFALATLAVALFAALGLGLYLRSLKREAEAARTRSEFLTMVTHELKTPLAGIRLLAEMLEDGRVHEASKRKEYFARISSESTRLGTLIENVLDLGRLERGERSYSFERVELGEIAREVVSVFEPILERDGMGIDFVREGESLVDGDRHAITQALLNVLDNARKYAAAGRRIVVDVRERSIRVRDFGPGVPPSLREAIFARFERGPAERDGHIPGVGIGLHLARSIVLAHGGTLRVEDPGDILGDERGACFVLSFPPLSERGATSQVDRPSSEGVQP